jgi:hypothetical protein
MDKPRFRLFFTPIGGAVLVIALVILIRSLYARNAYEIVISCVALLLLLALGIVGAWRAQKFKLMETGWKPPFPMTAGAGEDWLISGIDIPVPLFFRLHFITRGRFYPTGSGADSSNWCPVLAETSVSRNDKTGKLSLDFPISGVYIGDCFCRLKDIFGFYSFACGIPQRRTVKVRSSPCFGKKLPIKAQSGAEDRRNKTSTDEERYYMREYTPGDRFRDINWKSSEKVDSLITRISPDNQEKVSRIDVYFRNFGPSEKPSLEELWLLDRAKARLSFFLRSLKEEQSSYIFHVRTAAGSWVIEDTEDLEGFLEELAGLSFSAPQSEAFTGTAGGVTDLFVFSTACDRGLNAFILACNPRPVSLFIVQGTGSKEQRAVKEKTEILVKRDFLANGAFPLPRWLRKGKINRLGVNAFKVDMTYAGTKL